MQRRRFKQTISLQDRLAAFADEMREKASKAAPGPERDNLNKRARHAETAVSGAAGRRGSYDPAQTLSAFAPPSRAAWQRVYLSEPASSDDVHGAPVQ
jgi:hypothetical protein